MVNVFGSVYVHHTGHWVVERRGQYRRTTGNNCDTVGR